MNTVGVLDIPTFVDRLIAETDSRDGFPAEIGYFSKEASEEDIFR